MHACAKTAVGVKSPISQRTLGGEWIGIQRAEERGDLWHHEADEKEARMSKLRMWTVKR